MAKRELHAEARRLRMAGWSLRRIARELGVSLSSASVWTRGVDPPRAAESAPPPPLAPEPLRWCSRCSRHRPESCFNRFGAGRQWWCRDCFKAYYAERHAHHRGRNNALKTLRVREAQDLVLAFLRVHPCVDCQETDPVVLEFDHLGPKRSEISTLVARGVLEPVLVEEMAHCEVVCANCHRRRTAERHGWWLGGWRSKPQERNVLFARDVLNASGCVDCGELDVRVLEFDHVGAKTDSVMRLARREVGLARLSAEIQRCEVRCVNCHRRRTARQAGAFRARAEYPQRESNSRYEVENLAC